MKKRTTWLFHGGSVTLRCTLAFIRSQLAVKCKCAVWIAFEHSLSTEIVVFMLRKCTSVSTNQTKQFDRLMNKTKREAQHIRSIARLLSYVPTISCGHF